MAARHANVVVRHLSNNHIAPRQTVIRDVTAALAQVDDLADSAKDRILNALTANMDEIRGCSECTEIIQAGVALTVGDEEAE